jgi:hypothetical protein
MQPEAPTNPIRSTRLLRPEVRIRMHAIREALRFQRLARAARTRWAFCASHDMFDDAERARAIVLDRLRAARRRWRVALGLAMDTG